MFKIQNIKNKVFRNFLLRAAVLVSLKEFYLFLRNLYGLVVHPFKTIVEIRKKPDRSQTILIFGLPVYGGIGVMGGIGLSLVLVLLFRPTNELLVNFLFFFLSCSVLLVSGYALYLGFWTRRYLKIKTPA